jgi:hypothetical protein
VTGRSLAGACAGAAALVLAAGRLTALQRKWGATAEEIVRPMPGDDVVPEARYLTTRAITVDAPPECIYPWLKQVGCGRGGLYSYDFLDRLFGYIDAPSAREILPEFQDLAEGDSIPLGRGAPFPVVQLEEGRTFVLGDPEVGWSWSTCLYPQPDGSTRLVTRNRAAPRGVGARFALELLDVAAFVMVRRWLVVLKQRAEGLDWAVGGWASASAGAPG